MSELYYDEKSGLIYARPFKELELPVTVGSIDEANQILERQFRDVQHNLRDTAVLKGKLSRTYQIARTVLNSRMHHGPTLLAIGSSYYTGWYYLSYKGKIYIAFGRRRKGHRISDGSKPQKTRGLTLN